jgi:hypothetical protein
MRQALDAVLHGTDTAADLAEAAAAPVVPPVVPPVDPRYAGASVDTVDLEVDPRGVWEALLRFEESRWLRYGHPCVAVQMEIVGGDDVTTRLGSEAGSRVYARLEELLASMTRASDHFEPRAAWRVVALLPETDLAGATTALERLRAAFAEAMGPALAVRLAFGLATPAPTGTLTVAFHQANQQLVSQRRSDRPRVVAGVSASSGGSGGSIAGDAPESAEGPQRLGPRKTSHDLGDRLDALTRLREGGYVSEAEYVAKRTEILGRL